MKRTLSFFVLGKLNDPKQIKAAAENKRKSRFLFWFN